jgi:hypothetical protein
MILFREDPEWVKFECVRLALNNKTHAEVPEMIKHAEQMFNFIMPKATCLEMHVTQETKDAPKVRKK